MRRLHAAGHVAENVVKLPGAAGRKVENGRYAEQRRVSLAARRASPFADRYKSTQDREADRLASGLSMIEQTPALLIVSAMLRTMDEAAVAKIMAQLAPGAAGKRPPHEQAVATVKASRLNVGQQYDLLRALDRLHGEGR